MRQHFQRQEEVVGHWVKLCQWLRASNLVRAKKIEKVRDMIASNSEFSVLSSFKALPLPLDPTIRMSGVKRAYLCLCSLWDRKLILVSFLSKRRLCLQQQA
jgi:hypothetical protein